jgi:crossover junction endodeoxyribonuclease RuvC
MFDPERPGPILGIDPGLSRCGYGAVLREGARLRAVAAGVVRTPPSWALPDRLVALADELESLMDDLAPSAVVVERVLFQVNARTAISVGQASGLALAAAARRGLPVVQYSPNEVKLAVTGDGAADKAAVQAMVTRQLNLAEVPEPPDAADALALAICHAWRARFMEAQDASTPANTTAALADGPPNSSRYEARVAAALAKQRGAAR